MAAFRSRWAVMAATVGLGVAVVGAGPAAAGSAKTVLSDSVKFSGPIALAPVGDTFKTTSCSLLSDGESKPFNCKMTGAFHTNSTNTIVGTAKLVSADGTTTWKYVLTETGFNTYKMNGTGVEADAPENGKPSPKYKATMTGQWTMNTASPPLMFSPSTVTVSESSTAP